MRIRRHKSKTSPTPSSVEKRGQSWNIHRPRFSAPNPGQRPVSNAKIPSPKKRRDPRPRAFPLCASAPLRETSPLAFQTDSLCANPPIKLAILLRWYRLIPLHGKKGRLSTAAATRFTPRRPPSENQKHSSFLIILRATPSVSTNLSAEPPPPDTRKSRTFSLKYLSPLIPAHHPRASFCAHKKAGRREPSGFSNFAVRGRLTPSGNTASCSPSP